MSNVSEAIAPTAPKKDFDDLVALLDSLTEHENELTALNSRLNTENLANVRLHTDTYKRLQTRIGEVEAALVVIAARNPAWFADKKTLSTPYGLVKRTTSTALVIPDEAVSITLIKAAGREKDFLVTTTAIRREAVETLDDADLAKFGIRRETTHNYKPEAASVDLGKSVKAAEKSDKAAAKTVKKTRE